MIGWGIDSPPDAKRKLHLVGPVVVRKWPIVDGSGTLGQ